MISLNVISSNYAAIKKDCFKTPVVNSKFFNEQVGCEIFFKCENFQKTGAFKIRGALTAINSLNKDVESVVTHSSGNHGAALAYAASLKGIKAYIVVPNNARASKIQNMERYGGNIIFCEPNHKSRLEECERIQKERKAALIPPYDDERIILGQASVALEFLEEIPDLDALICPLGGGGLLSGTLLAAKQKSPTIKVFGVEPEGAGECILRLKEDEKWKTFKPISIADGLLAPVSDLTFSLIKKYVDQIFIVTDKEILSALELFQNELNINIEPSSAVCLAAILRYRNVLSKFQKVGVILSGGNV